MDYRDKVRGCLIAPNNGGGRFTMRMNHVRHKHNATWLPLTVLLIDSGSCA